ncbi:hypothetical protein ONS96_006787 [Cadophora gregata f. sp. sojae]|nr:hypothetical protein ONS96_006787 [Cadophora gregata f. sp. sojae]
MAIMTTYRGHVRTRQDAILLFEACQLDVLPKIQRRLSRKERKDVILPGAVFVWDEVEAGIQRWTDGRLWGSITLSEEFIIRREMERKARRPSNVQERPVLDADSAGSRRGSDGGEQMEEETTDDYQYKKNGLVRRSMTISSNGRQLHLVTYDDQTCRDTSELPCPTTDSLLKHLVEEKIASRSAPPLTIFHESRLRTENRYGDSNACLQPVFGAHFNGALPSNAYVPDSRDPNLHCSAPPGRIHQGNETAMNLYRLLASLTQSSSNMPQGPPPQPQHLENYCVRTPAMSTYPPPFFIPAVHTYPFQTIPPPQGLLTSSNQLHAPFPPVFVSFQQAGVNAHQRNHDHFNPLNNTIEMSNSAGAPGSIGVQSVSFPPCSSLPMPEIPPNSTGTPHKGLSTQKQKFRAVGTASETGWENGKKGDVSNQTLKVHRDDANAVRSLDKRFLID